LHSFDLLFGKYGKKLYGFAVAYLKSEAMPKNGSGV
jgi:hypothetical protein